MFKTSILACCTFILGFSSCYYINGGDRSTAVKTDHTFTYEAVNNCVDMDNASQVSSFESHNLKQYANNIESPHPENIQQQDPIDQQASNSSIAFRLNGLLNNGNNFSEVESLLKQWASIDIVLAEEWLNNLSDSEQKNALYYSFLREYMKQDMSAAGNMILAIDDQNLQIDLLIEYVPILASNNLNQAINWASNLSGNAREQAYLQSMQAIALNSPEQALETLSWLNLSPQSEEVAAVISQIGYQLSTHSKEPAIDKLWLYSEELQPQIAYGIISDWVSNDKAAVANWIDSLQSSPLKDKAIESYINHAYDPSSLQQFFTLAEQITNQDTRTHLIEHIYSDWIRTAPQVAQQAFTSTTKLDVSRKRFILCE